jgi:DNA-binding beta-propeller fold protein YncE
MKKSILFILLITMFPVSGQPLKALYNQSIKAYQEKNYPKLLEISKRIDTLRPSHPTYTYNLAIAYALNGKTDEAISGIEKSVLMNNKTAFENDADLASLKASPGYEKLLELKSSLDKPVMTSEKVVALDQKDLHPEGLLYLPPTKTWLATSIRNGKIVSFDPKTGKCKDWLAIEGMFSVFALKADSDERVLWAATSAVPQLASFKPELEGKAEVLKIDISSRKILARYSIDGNHVFGDLAVSKNGTVYISDSATAAIYKIENNEMTEWLNLAGHAFNLQGITFDAKQTTLYIADYLKGILKIEMASKSTKWLAFPEGTTVKGIDGLLWHANSLIAVQNGVNPIRIIRFELDNKGELSGYKIVDHNRPEFNEPAMGAIHDDKFYFFANCPWNADDEKSILDISKAEAPALYSFRP